MYLPELLLKLFITVAADQQVRCRKNTATFEDAKELEKKDLVIIQTGTRVDTAYISLSINGSKLYDEIEKLFIEQMSDQQ